MEDMVDGISGKKGETRRGSWEIELTRRWTQYYTHPSTTHSSQIMADEVVFPIPNLRMPHNLFILSNPLLTHLHPDAKKELLEGIKADRQSILFDYGEHYI